MIVSTKEKILKGIIKVGTFATLFLPFIVADFLFFPFITGKNFAFRIIIELLVVAWAWLAVSNKKYRPTRSAIMWAVVAFFGVVALATIFSINPFKSFFSNAERMEGLFGLLHLFAFFFMAISVFNKKDWMQFFFTSLIASVGVAFHGFFQKLGIMETNRGNRVDANFGNSTYLAMYLVFHFFFALWFIARIRLKKYVPLARGAGRKIFTWLFGMLAVFHIVVLWFTDTRGAILGLLGGLFLTTLLTTVLADKGRAKRWGMAALVVVVLIPIIFFTFKDTALVQETPVVKRFAEISLTEGTAGARLTLWDMTIDAWQEKPILGWGPGNFTTVFAEHYRPELWRQEPWFDRPHNVSMQWLVSTGAVGFVAYHTLFIVALMYLWRLYKREDFSAFEGSLFAGLFAAYFIHNLFVFDNVVSYLLFFAVLGWLHHRYQKTVVSSQESGKANNTPRVNRVAGGWGKTIAMVVTLAMFFSLYAYNIRPIKATDAVQDALKPLAASQLGTRNVNAAQENFKRAINLNTFLVTEAREQLITKGTKVSQAQAASAEARTAYLNYAKQQGEKHIGRFPHDMRMRTFLATQYVQTGDFEKGEELAEKIIERAPNRALFWLILGEARLNQNKLQEALAAFETAYNLTPHQPQAQEGYVIGMLYAGDINEAKALIKKHYDGSPFPPFLRVVQAYINLGRIDDAIITAEKLVQSNPSKINWRYNLALLYIHDFRDAAAIEELQRIAELDPRLESRINTLIEQIRNGTIDRDI